MRQEVRMRRNRLEDRAARLLSANAGRAMKEKED